MALTLTLAFMPLHILVKEVWPSDALKQVLVVVGSGALGWSTLLWAVARTWRLHLASSKLAGTWALPVHEENLVAAAKFLGEGALHDVEVRIRGTVEGLNDSGLTIQSTPEAIPTLNGGAIILPALFWIRLRSHTRALAAVLAHEVAHLRNRDVILLTDLRRFMLGVAAVSFITATLSFAVSVRADLGGGSANEWRLALQAAVAGKNFLIVSIALLSVVWLLMRRLEYWREALADYEAIRIIGEEGLQRAEQLVAGSAERSPLDVHGQRPRRLDAARALTLTAREAVLLGFIAAAVAEYSSGPLSYLGKFIFVGHPSANALLAAAAFAHSAILSTLVFIASRTYAVDASWRGQPILSPVIRACIWLLMGTVVCRLLSQALPASLTALLMPQGFDAPSIHDPQRLFVAGIAGGAIANADTILMGGASSVLSVTGLSRPLALLPTLAWCILSAAEAHYFPALAQGAIAPIVTSALWLVFLPWPWRAHSRLGSVSPTLALIVGLSLAGFLGLAEDSHLGDCATSAGAQRLSAGNASGAVEPLRHATFLLRFQAKGWHLLALALAQSSAHLPEAVNAAENAVRAPYSSDWQVMLDSSALAGALRLKIGTPADLVLAEEHFLEAVRLWHKNSRLNKAIAAGAFYSLACVKVRRGSDLADASVDLIEAITLQPSLSLEALADPNLSPLDLLEQPLPNHAVLTRLSGLSLEDGDALRKAYRRGDLEAGDVLALAGTIVKNSAQAARKEGISGSSNTAP